MAEYPVSVPRGEHQHEVARSIEAYINARFDGISAERMTFSYAVIAAELGLPVETVRDVLASLEGGDADLMVWRNKRRKPRGKPRSVR